MVLESGKPKIKGVVTGMILWGFTISSHSTGEKDKRGREEGKWGETYTPTLTPSRDTERQRQKHMSSLPQLTSIVTTLILSRVQSAQEPAASEPFHFNTAALEIKCLTHEL